MIRSNLFYPAYPEEEGDDEKTVDDLFDECATPTDEARLVAEVYRDITTHIQKKDGTARKNKPGPRFTGSEAQVRINNLRAGGDLTPEAWRRMVRAHQGCCAYCGLRVWPLQLEHVVPVSAGGVTDESNVVPACALCNSRKSDRVGLEWLGAQGIVEFFGRRAMAAANMRKAAKSTED